MALTGVRACCNLVVAVVVLWTCLRNLLRRGGNHRSSRRSLWHVPDAPLQTPSSATTTITTSLSRATFARLARGTGPKAAPSATFLSAVAGKTSGRRSQTPPPPPPPQPLQILLVRTRETKARSSLSLFLQELPIIIKTKCLKSCIRP